jgi:hypothetical protein
MQAKYLRSAAVAAALLVAMATSALADIKDYEFQLIDTEVKQGEATIAVKLVHKPSGRAIPDAVIFAKRLDMGPDKMEAMTAPLDACRRQAWCLPFQDRSYDGGQLGVVAGRESGARRGQLRQSSSSRAT